MKNNVRGLFAALCFYTVRGSEIRFGGPRLFRPTIKTPEKRYRIPGSFLEARQCRRDNKTPGVDVLYKHLYFRTNVDVRFTAR